MVECILSAVALRKASVGSGVINIYQDNVQCMGGAMPANDKQVAPSVKKAATRDLPNKGANTVNMSQGTCPLPKDKGPTTEPGKAVGTKRLQSDTPSSPVYHNVYVRRKVESEHSKVNTSQELKGNGRDKAKEQEAQQDAQHDEANKPKVASPVTQSVELVPSKPPFTESVEQVPSKPPVTESAEQVPSKPPVTESAEQVPSKPPVTESVEQVPSKPPVTESLEQVPSKPPVTESVEQVPSPPVTESVEQVPSKPPVTESVEQVPSKPPVTESVEQVSSKPPEKPNAGVTPEKIEPPVASGTGIQDDIQQASIQYWNERFNRLQTYLENCDRSNQETYLRKLRSLSAAGRSMHAIELEKRAIHLLVEEGKELQRMKALNVLGKVSPNASSKQTPLQRQLQK